MNNSLINLITSRYCVTTKISKIASTLLSLFVAVNIVNAQDITTQENPIPAESTPTIKNPPVSVEAMFSNNGLHFQTLIQKKLVSLPKLGFFVLGDILGKWDDSQADGYMIQGKLTYQIAQGLYAHTTDGGLHSRSYARFRVGLSYKEFSFGFGGNIDYYGPQTINENSFGVFVTTTLF